MSGTLRGLDFPERAGKLLSPMKIGIDVSRTAEAKTGLGSAAISTIAALAQIDRENEYLLYPFVWDCFPENYEQAYCPAQPNFRMARKRVPKWLIHKLWASGKVDKGRILGGDPDVFFSPLHSVPQRTFRRLVCLFHDVSFRVHPEFSTQANIDHCEMSFARARTAADRLVTSSHYSKMEMVEKMGVPAEWISVIHLAADPLYRVIEDCRLPERVRKDIGEPEQTILYVGSVEPRKNLPTLIRAFDALIQRGACRPKLVIAGGSGWSNSDVYAEIDRRGLKDEIYFTGFVTDEELLQLYNSTSVFAFPTIYEGFGLPVIEAMSCGVPVVTSHVASIPEVGGDAVIYNEDPYDDEALSRQLEEVLLDRELRADLRRRGLDQAATFSWERCARETLAVLEEVHRDPKYAREQVVMGVDERGLARGWHPTENDGQYVYRWAGREAALRLTPTSRSAEFVMEAVGSLPSEEQVLAVRVNGYLIGSAPLATEWRTLRFPVPAAIPVGREIEVTLRVNRELPPAMRGGDDRSLGFRVARAGFGPTSYAFPGA